MAAPASSLHFTPELVSALEAKGSNVTSVTLHKALGSFQPIEVEDLNKHPMDAERISITPEAASLINNAMDLATARVTACGPTVIRALESSLSANQMLKAVDGWTDKFICPGYDFQIADRLLSNFQRPRSTLLVVKSAFMGYELMRHAYDEAVRHEYRLFSFGDAMLIL